MELEQYNFSVEENQENNLKDLLVKYLFHWKWFVVSVIISLLIGRYYLKYQMPYYEVNATILIKDDAKGELSELSAFEDLGLVKKSSNIDNEIEILKSRALMMHVVNELTLNISYFIKESHLENELYKNSPVQINFVAGDSSYLNKYGSFYVVIDSKTRVTIKNGNDEELGKYNIGDVISNDLGKFKISTTPVFTDWYIGKTIHVNVAPVIAVADNYRSSIQVYPVNKSSSVLMLTLQSPVIEKAVNIIDNLIKQHNADAIADKNQVSKNTAEFINERIQFISNELSSVETEAENFKTKNKLTDVESEAKLYLQTGSESEMSQLDATTQVRIAEFMNDYIKKHDNPGDLIPGNIGLSEGSLDNQINDYNKLVMTRNRMLKNAGAKNPVIENMDAQINGIRNTIKESLVNLQSTLEIRASEIAKKENQINSKIGSVPKYEREYRSIQRQQQIKEALYLYLLQKREETNIALAVTVANAKIIDSAYSNGGMVAPKRNKIYTTLFIIGLVVPIIILLLLDLLDTKIHGKKDIEKIKIPFLSDIPQTSIKERMVVTTNNNSSLVEAFRLLRTNVEFITGNKRGANKTVFVTSTIGKEGKSFIALNMAASFALSGRRTLLVGTDLRAPKILEYLHLSERKGLTNYITDTELGLNDVIFKAPNQDNLDILSSGPIPPNPAELLMSPRIKELFEQVKEAYDYVIVDTAPVGLVADTLLLSAYADCTVYVVRANYLDKRLLRIAETLNKEKRLPNMAILINGSDFKKGYGNGYGYGYGYTYGGYGYGEEKQKPKWRRLIGF